MTALYQHELAEAKAHVPNPNDPPEPDPVTHLNEQLATVLAENHPTDVANEVYGVVTGKFISIREPMDRLIATRTTNARTASTKRSVINRFLEHTGIDYMHQWSRQVTRGYLQSLVDSGRSGSTAGIHKAHLSAYYSDLRRLHDYEAPDPFTDVQPIAPKGTIDTQPFSVGEINRLLAATGNANPTLHTMILLAAYTGCRFSELALLTKDNLSHDHLVVTGAKTKSGNRIVPLHHKIADLIHSLAEASTNDYAIGNLRTVADGRRGSSILVQFGNLKDDLGFAKRVHSFHSIRGTVATLLEQAGANPIALHRLLGHGISSESYGTYSGGASMKQLKDTVNLIDYSEL